MHRECGVTPVDRKDLLKVRSLRNSSERMLTHHIGKHLEYDRNLKSSMKKRLRFCETYYLPTFNKCLISKSVKKSLLTNPLL